MNFSGAQSSDYPPQSLASSGGSPYSRSYLSPYLQKGSRSAEDSLDIEREPNTPLLSRSSWGSDTSVSSSDSEEWISIDQHPTIPLLDTAQHTSKPVSKYSRLMNVTLRPPFGKKDPLKAASIEMDKIYYDLTTYDKQFKYPSDLRFSINLGSPLMLVDIQKYMPVLEQLRKLEGLRVRLAGVPTHGDMSLEDKHADIDAAIDLALYIINEHRLKLYGIAVESALDEIILDLSACVRQIEYPSKLGFVLNSDNHLMLGDTKRNQLRKLNGLREKLGSIPEYGDKQLQDRRKNIGLVIERALQEIRCKLESYRDRHPEGC